MGGANALPSDGGGAEAAGGHDQYGHAFDVAGQRGRVGFAVEKYYECGAWRSVSVSADSHSDHSGEGEEFRFMAGLDVDGSLQFLMGERRGWRFVGGVGRR